MSVCAQQIRGIIVDSEYLNRRAALVSIGAATLIGGCGRIGAHLPQGNSINVLLFNVGQEVPEIYRHRHQFYADTRIPNKIKPAKYEELRTQIENPASGFDVVYVDDVWMAEYADRHMLLNITDYIQRRIEDISGDYPQQILDDMARTEPGVYWMVPQRADVQVLYYNRAIFDDKDIQRAYLSKHKKKLTPPNTWNEYYEIAKFLHLRPFGEGRIVGTVETLKAPHYAFEFFACRFWNRGTFFDDDLRPSKSIFVENAIETVRMMKPGLQYADPGSLDYGHGSEGEIGSINQFKQGMTAMMPQWYSFYSEISNSDTKLGDNCGVALLPGQWANGQLARTPCLGGGSLAIPSYSRKAPFAFEFIRYFTGPDYSRHAADNHLITPRDSAYEGKEEHVDSPVHIYRYSISQARPRPRHSHFANVLEDAIGHAVNKALHTDDESAWRQYFLDAARRCDDDFNEDHRESAKRGRSI